MVVPYLEDQVLRALPLLLPHKRPPLLWSASSPPWPAVPAGSSYRDTFGWAWGDVKTQEGHKPCSPNAPRSWDRSRPNAPASSARLPRPPPKSRPGTSRDPWPALPGPSFALYSAHPARQGGHKGSRCVREDFLDCFL
jgi:hypothetical protein